MISVATDKVIAFIEFSKHSGHMEKEIVVGKDTFDLTIDYFVTEEKMIWHLEISNQLFQSLDLPENIWATIFYGETPLVSLNACFNKPGKSSVVHLETEALGIFKNRYSKIPYIVIYEQDMSAVLNELSVLSSLDPDD